MQQLTEPERPASSRGSTPAEPVRIQGEPVTSPKTALLSRPSLALMTLLLLAVVGRFAPLPQWLRLGASRPVVESSSSGPDAQTLALGEAELPETHTGLSPGQEATRVGARGPIPSEPAELPEINTKEPPLPIENPDALANFFGALARTAAKTPGAITRILHFGDSLIVSDFVSSRLRRNLQDQFGDAGHGFLLLANAWPAYFHNDVYRFASSGWKVSRIVGPLNSDGWYGLGGVSFRAPAGARARFGSAKTGEYGRRVSRFELDYVEEPGSASIEINVDGHPHSTLTADAPKKNVARHTLEVPDGEHEFEVVVRGRGTARAFGVVLERQGPGVVLDAIGIQGARIRFLDKQDDAHWAEQLAWRRPNLLIYEFGANESGDGFAYSMEDYRRTMTEVLLQGKKAVTDSSCFIVGAMDRAAKVGDQIVSMRVIPHIVREQEAASKDAGCAFFNTFKAMGGNGSMPIWVRRGLGQADLTHPSGAGSEALGNWLFRGLMQGYDRYLSQQKRGSADVTAASKDARKIH
jgi:hypothetical protein